MRRERRDGIGEDSVGRFQRVQAVAADLIIERETDGRGERMGKGSGRDGGRWGVLGLRSRDPLPPILGFAEDPSAGRASRDGSLTLSSKDLWSRHGRASEVAIGGRNRNFAPPSPGGVRISDALGVASWRVTKNV